MVTENILQYLPHRPPFVMVDNLLHADETNTRTSFVIKQENILFENGFFSEAGLLENIAQTAAAGAGYKEQTKHQNISGGYIAAVKNFEVYTLPKIHDLLITEIVITEKIFNMTVIAGKVLCGDTLLAQCEMKVISNADN